MSLYKALASRREHLFAVLENPYDFQALEKAWRSYFSGALYHWGWNKAAVHMLFDWGRGGHNWELLHWPETTTVAQRDQLLEEFASEVRYCSDRLSPDRLLRCHYLYNQIQDPVRYQKTLVCSQ